MASRARQLVVVAVAIAACARTSPPVHRPLPSWPVGDDPVVRLATVYPDPAADRPERAWWRRGVDAVLGEESAAPAAAWAPARPFGVAATAGGVVFVADPDARTVTRIDLATREAAPVECAGRRWAMPLAAAVAPDGALWVADGEERAVVRVAPGGCAAIGAGVLERPSGVAFVGTRAFIVDPPRHRVVAFTELGAEAGAFGSHGDGPGELNFPTAVAAAPDGTLLVVDALNFRISRYSADGRFEGAFGEPGEEPGEFARPKAVATDARGRIYVTDAQGDAVLVFSPEGDYLFTVGGPGDGPGMLAAPSGVAVQGGRMVVADSLHRRVQVYDLLGDGT